MRDAEVRRRVERVEELLAAIEGDHAALEALQGVVALYGEALRRVVERVGGAHELAGDELVSHLLLVHGLHPRDAEQRVEAALDEVRPYLATHGGDVELVGVAGSVARVRLTGTCDGCPSSAATLRHAVEEAILAAAPELDRVEADGVAEPGPVLLQISSLECPPGLAGARTAR